MTTLCAAPSDANVAAARDAWIATRSPWEQSEAFLFGPVADFALDPALDSWPVDRTQLDHVLASDFELTADFITESLGATLKGFHTIEYLLWGTDHEQAAQALAGGRYFAQLDAVQQLVSGMIDICDEVATGMIDICDEVATGKIADPFDERNPNLVESQFAFNSLLDFADNVRSVRNTYTAEYDGQTGASLAAWVATAEPALDARVRAEIDAAIAAIQAIGEGGVRFRDAILDPARAAAIEAAQDAIRTLMNTLGRDVLRLVSGG